MAHVHGLGDRDLNVVDIVAIPQGLENGVSESEEQNVLGGFLSKVVVDAIDLVFAENVLDLVVERARGGEIAAERLFYDRPPITLVLLGHVARAEMRDDRLVKTRPPRKSK